MIKRLQILPEYSQEIERETRRRILLSIAAYAYEMRDDSIMTDMEFDMMALKVDLAINTRRPDLDRFFRKEFQAWTGNWVRSHPEIDKLRFLYEKYFKGQRRRHESLARKTK